MLNKLIKIIEIAAIIGLNGLDVWGSDDYEIWDGTGPMPTENVLIEYNPSGGIKRVIVFKNTNDPIPELVYEEDETKENYGETIGLRLNFPEELIQDCEYKRWKIRDEILLQELDEIVATEENFHNWCNEQEQKKSSYSGFDLRCQYAYILKKVNEKNYLVPGDFCKQVNLGSKLRSIHEKGVTYCMSGLYNDTPVGRYIGSLESIIEYEW